MQVTAGSLVGKFGEAAQNIAEQILLRGDIEILASDSHNLVHRTPDLSEGYRRAKQLIGEAEAIKLVMDNPMAIVRSQFS